ncbi:DUF4333 domain-containing protein [Nocardiopsis sp. LOL_012]|uniref:DUF4333 domain-containing protein n=1 Tax=Nocardiopsis sp. LOL_012 TaxID=3345409 RepID=UPI003A85F8AF
MARQQETKEAAMRQVSRKPVIVGAALGALPLLLTGCSFNFSIGGPSAVDAEQVAQESSRILAEQVGEAPDAFTCPEDLPAEVGAEIRCELTDGDATYGVTLTTTSVDGGNVNWDVQVDEAPTGATTPADEGAAQDTAGNDTVTEDAPAAVNGSVPAATVAEQSAAQLAAIGQPFEDFSCSEPLPAQVGAEIRCNLVQGGMNYGVTVTATSVDGDYVGWDILVDDAPL